MTLADYAREVHAANLKWWLDLDKPCEKCSGTGDFFASPSEDGVAEPTTQNCSDCGGNGYTKKKRNLGEMTMLAISELSEALEGDRKDLMDDKLPHRKMKEVELADFIIRVFDTVEGHFGGFMGKYADKGNLNSMGEQFTHDFTDDAHSNFAESLLRITKCCVRAHENHSPTMFYFAIGYALALGHQLGMDLEGAYQEKMQYNAKRADHSIAGRLATGGKKY